VYDGDPVVQKEAGLWLRATQPATIRLMALDPFTPFYFYDKDPYPRFAALPFVHSPAELVAAARTEKADVIVVPEWFTKLGGPDVAPLIDPDLPAPPELQRMIVLGQSPTRVFIYRLLPAAKE
jgi:hypothetical protein